MAAKSPSQGTGKLQQRKVKAHKARIHHRYVQVIEECIGEGMSGPQIARRLCEKHEEKCKPDCKDHFGLDLLRAQRLVVAVFKKLHDHQSEQNDNGRTQILEMMYSCFRGSYRLGEFRDAARTAMDIARLRGILEPAAPPQILQLFANLPSDAERFPGDPNYQALAAARGMLAQRAAMGNIQAGRAVGQVSRAMVREFGVTRSGMNKSEESELIERVRARVIQNEWFGGEKLEPITKPVNDFANLQAPVKPGDKPV